MQYMKKVSLCMITEKSHSQAMLSTCHTAQKPSLAQFHTVNTTKVCIYLVIVLGNPQVFWEQPVPNPSKTHTLVKGTGLNRFRCRFEWVVWVQKPAWVDGTGRHGLHKLLESSYIKLNPSFLLKPAPLLFSPQITVPATAPFHTHTGVLPQCVPCASGASLHRCFECRWWCTWHFHVSLGPGVQRWLWGLSVALACESSSMSRGR